PGRTLASMYGDNLEPPPVQLEAIKALGQMRFAEALPAVSAIAQSDPDPRLRWVAHWAAQRISGTDTPLAPPMSQWSADTSLVAVGQEASVGFEGVAALGAYYVPGTWTPLRFTLINNSPRTIDGYVQLPLK